MRFCVSLPPSIYNQREQARKMEIRSSELRLIGGDWDKQHATRPLLRYLRLWQQYYRLRLRGRHSLHCTGCQLSNLRNEPPVYGIANTYLYGNDSQLSCSRRHEEDRNVRCNGCRGGNDSIWCHSLAKYHTRKNHGLSPLPRGRMMRAEFEHSENKLAIL